MAKRIDRFLVSESLAMSHDIIKQWVSGGGNSDHIPIVFELYGGGAKPPNPFKFNHCWLTEAKFQYLVKRVWRSLGTPPQGQAVRLFNENIKCLNQTTLSWAHDKRMREHQELRELEHQILAMLEVEGVVFLS